MGASDSPLTPNWLEGAATPGAGFRKLLSYLAKEYASETRDEKVLVFRAGVESIRLHVGPLEVTREFWACYPGQPHDDVQVFVGKPARYDAPVIAFDQLGRVWTGSLRFTVGTMADGRQAFNAFRANRIC